ncbi:hypothetical protein FLAG1_06507 [Fusarium langsethiae]|uniref:Uncharacterized protein n=1 Tax=Fusarium langsethiae TaxID=179993 RepID=A0A0M9EW01_FUSLA|nr:hypothetical protein FLAG1_06507 [Fusarium langsethiae]GKU04893.1 unnamed protein product [Fusarium langsethiae]GKU21579.1 unnamed protein product [Fusarium langsethiae]
MPLCLLFTLSFGCAGTLASLCKPSHIVATSTSDTVSSLSGDTTTSIVPTSDILTMSTLLATSDLSSESTTSITDGSTIHFATTLETDLAASSFTSSATLDTTSSSPTTTSSAEPFNFKLTGATRFLSRTEMRADLTAPNTWAIGTFMNQKPTVLTREADTGHLLFEGKKLCVKFQTSAEWWLAVRNCLETMLSQHRHVVCDSVHAEDDELRCRVLELTCVYRGIEPGYSCKRTGKQWTHFYARNLFLSHFLVGMDSPPNGLLHRIS